MPKGEVEKEGFGRDVLDDDGFGFCGGFGEVEGKSRSESGNWSQARILMLGLGTAAD